MEKERHRHVWEAVIDPDNGEIIGGICRFSSCRATTNMFAPTVRPVKEKKMPEPSEEEKLARRRSNFAQASAILLERKEECEYEFEKNNRLAKGTVAGLIGTPALIVLNAFLFDSDIIGISVNVALYIVSVLGFIASGVIRWLVSEDLSDSRKAVVSARLNYSRHMATDPDTYMGNPSHV